MFGFGKKKEKETYEYEPSKEALERQILELPYMLFGYELLKLSDEKNQAEPLSVRWYKEAIEHGILNFPRVKVTVTGVWEDNGPTLGLVSFESHDPYGKYEVGFPRCDLDNFITQWICFRPVERDFLMSAFDRWDGHLGQNVGLRTAESDGTTYSIKYLRRFYEEWIPVDCCGEPGRLFGKDSSIDYSVLLFNPAALAEHEKILEARGDDSPSPLSCVCYPPPAPCGYCQQPVVVDRTTLDSGVRYEDSIGKEPTS